MAAAHLLLGLASPRQSQSHNDHEEISANPLPATHGFIVCTHHSEPDFSRVTIKIEASSRFDQEEQGLILVGVKP